MRFRPPVARAAFIALAIDLWAHHSLAQTSSPRPSASSTSPTSIAPIARPLTAPSPVLEPTTPSVVTEPQPTVAAPTVSSPEVAEAARRLFREGAQLASQGRWEDARDRFRRALAVRPSPLLRFNLAVAAQNSGHFVEAIDQYRQFLLDDSDPANALRRQEAQAAITAIENVLARLIIVVRGTDAPVQLRLDGHALPLVLLGEEIPVDPTTHVVECDGAHGGSARQSIQLRDGWQQTITLVVDTPASAAPSIPSAAPPSAPRRNASNDSNQPATVNPGTIERVRRVIEERASTADEFGSRRWARTLVFYAFQGLGNPNGLLGVGLRWSARPWIAFELQGGGGHPFGPGVGLFIAAGTPLSYRYGFGLLMGVSTNYTQIENDTNGPGCRPGGTFTPVWFTGAVTHEWRTSQGFAFRVGLGVRYLINYQELSDSLAVHCSTQHAFTAPEDLFLDTPGLNRNGVPVLPWLMFDLGYAL